MATPSLSALARSARGRPRKYGRPSKAVSLTLPDDVVRSLTDMDADLGRAIVALVEQRKPAVRPTPSAAEIHAYGSHAVIVVSPVRVLRQLEGVQLVPLGNGRALISLAQPGSVPRLELEIRDALDRTDLNDADRAALTSIRNILRQTRMSRTLVLEERTIMVLASKRAQARR